VTILYYYPNMQPDIVDALSRRATAGIVIAGTGLGHVNKPLYPALDRAREAGVHVYMTVQTLWGYVQMYVYETGREIMEGRRARREHAARGRLREARLGPGPDAGRPRRGPGSSRAIMLTPVGGRDHRP
jgi:hypothetical protein